MQSSEIKGLTVFSIADGKEIGKVSDLLINADKKRAEYLTINIPGWYIAGVIPFDLIVGIGKDAVVIENQNLIKKLHEESAAIQLIESEIQLPGLRVLTNKGKIIGTVSEYYIDEKNGSIMGCELEDLDHTIKGIIPSSVILTFGKSVLVVNDQIDNYLLSSFEEVRDVQNKTDMINNEAVQIKQTKNVSEIKTENNDAPSVKSKAVELYEQKQREYLLGRTVNKELLDKQGGVIAGSGDIITDVIIDRAIEAGLFKVLMLSV